MRPAALTILGIILLAACAHDGTSGRAAAQAFKAADNRVSIETRGEQRCIRANGLPNHTTGRFPNPGNPNRIRPQNFEICLPRTPVRGSDAQPVRGAIGIAVNGVLIRPGTADWYDPGTRRGHSRNPASGWNLEGMGAADMLGIDANNAHADPRGIYHYHGPPTGLIETLSDTQIGWTADGFALHLAPDGVLPGWRLKPGERRTPPYGPHDGTYIQDFEFAGGAGTLDRCNGGQLGGEFVYFATRSFPFYPRCLWGRISRDFRRY
ncbi:MAG: YHYH protein [Pseudomonadota bacterium]